jgi:hypothetical protein
VKIKVSFGESENKDMPSTKTTHDTVSEWGAWAVTGVILFTILVIALA